MLWTPCTKPNARLASSPSSRHAAKWPPGVHEVSVEDAVDRRPLAGCRIVLVDENLDLVRVCERLLGNHGAKVFGTCSHVEAMWFLEDQSANVIISNLGEDGAGLDLIRQVRTAKDPRIASLAAVALSGYDHEEVIGQAFTRGFDLYLAKPVEIRELVRALAVLLQQHGGHHATGSGVV